MKASLLLFLYLLIGAGLNAQDSADKLYKDAVQLDHAFKLDVQKPLLKAGLKALKEEADSDHLEQQLAGVAKYIKRMRILVLEDEGMTLLPDGGKKFISDLRSENFEEYMTIRHETSRINVMVKEKRRKIRNILFLIMDDEEGLIMINVKSKMPVSIFETLDLDSSSD